MGTTTSDPSAAWPLADGGFAIFNRRSGHLAVIQLGCGENYLASERILADGHAFRRPKCRGWRFDATSPASVSGRSLLLRRERGKTGDARLGHRQRCRRCRLSPGGTCRHRGSSHGKRTRLLLTCRCAESTDADHGTDRDNDEKLDVTCVHDRSCPSARDVLS